MLFCSFHPNLLQITRNLHVIWRSQPDNVFCVGYIGCHMTYSNYRLNCQIIYYTEWNSISSDRESRILRYISIPNKSIFQNLIAFALIKLFKALKLRRYSKLGEKTFKTDKKKIGLLLDSILFLRKNRTDKSFWRCKFANS